MKKSKKKVRMTLVMKVILLVLLFLSIMMFTNSMNLVITKPMVPDIQKPIEIRVLPLKYSLISIAEEMYYINFLKYDREKLYQSYSEKEPGIYDYFLWLKDTYGKIKPEMQI